VAWLNRFFSFTTSLMKHVIESNPDLIAFSVTTPDYKWACQMAAQIRHLSDVPIVFGGCHATCLPEKVIQEPFVDYVMVGECEQVFPDFLRCMSNCKDMGSVNNVWFKKNGEFIQSKLAPLIGDLDVLPFPDKALFYEQMPYLQKTYTIIASRGCPYDCSYCNNKFMKTLYAGNGPFLRRRSVENVIDELKNAISNYAVENVLFNDEVFITDILWLSEFSKRYRKEIGLPYACYVNPEMVNENTIRLLKASGCVTVNMGIESIDIEMRKKVLNRHMSQETILRAIKLFKINQLFCRAYFIIGLPGQTEKDMLELARFCNEYRFGLPLIFWLNFFPKTQIAAEFQNRENRSLFDSGVRNLSTAGFTITGDTYNIRFARIQFLIFLIPIFSSKAVDRIIRYKIYRFFPARHQILYFHAIKLLKKYLIDFWHLPKRGKIKVGFLPIGQKYRFFMKKKIKNILWKP
jgi:anaerobic magnesium-protoporphyrin IX monomethyl ester cyclase